MSLSLKPTLEVGIYYSILSISCAQIPCPCPVYLVIGGLLSSHLLSYKVPLIELDSDWPCDGPLLKLAVNVANRLLPGELCL